MQLKTLLAGLGVLLLLANRFAAQANDGPVSNAASNQVASVCDYLGEKPPGDEPKVFGRGLVSVEGKNTHALRFSPGGRMLIFSRYPDGTSYYMVRTTNGWSNPVKTSFTGKEVAFDTASKRLFYYDRGGDLFWVQYGAAGFSAPTKLNGKINTPETEYYPSITARGNLFFSRNGKWDQGRIMMAKPEGNDFAEPVDLGDLVNTGGASHGFVAPDESYLLFNSPRAGSYTKNDVWISFRRQNGGWSDPVNLGEKINRDAMAVLCPTVSPDGKYLFFTRLQEGGAGYIYWISTAAIPELNTKMNSPMEKR
jgi:Tol biopolymer transport system component